MKWIKKFLSLFIEKTLAGEFFAYGFNYRFQNSWYNNEDFKERTIYLVLPLPINKYGKYVAYYTPDVVLEGERWLTVIIGFRYMKVGQKRIFRPIFYSCWVQIGNTKIIDTTYNMYLKSTLPKC